MVFDLKFIWYKPKDLFELELFSLDYIIVHTYFAIPHESKVINIYWTHKHMRIC